MIDNMVLIPEFKKIGIHLSGGADSSILYYALCEFYKNDNEAKIYVGTQWTNWKPAYKKASKNIIKIVGELTGKWPSDHYIYFNPKHTEETKEITEAYVDGIAKSRIYLIKKYKIDIWYNGITTNPPREKLVELVKKLRQEENLRHPESTYGCINNMNPDRHIDNAQHLPIYKKSRLDELTYYINYPFRKQDKHATYKAYKDLNMLDKLYPYTFSCEGIQENQNYEDINSPHCGKCLFCLERYYAFGKLT